MKRPNALSADANSANTRRSTTGTTGPTGSACSTARAPANSNHPTPSIQTTQTQSSFPSSGTSGTSASHSHTMSDRTMRTKELSAADHSASLARSTQVHQGSHSLSQGHHFEQVSSTISTISTIYKYREEQTSSDSDGSLHIPEKSLVTSLANSSITEFGPQVSLFSADISSGKYPTGQIAGFLPINFPFQIIGHSPISQNPQAAAFANIPMESPIFSRSIPGFLSGQTSEPVSVVKEKIESLPGFPPICPAGANSAPLISPNLIGPSIPSISLSGTPAVDSKTSVQEGHHLSGTQVSQSSPTHETSHRTSAVSDWDWDPSIVKVESGIQSESHSRNQSVSQSGSQSGGHAGHRRNWQPGNSPLTPVNAMLGDADQTITTISMRPADAGSPYNSLFVVDSRGRQVSSQLTAATPLLSPEEYSYMCQLFSSCVREIIKPMTQADYNIFYPNPSQAFQFFLFNGVHLSISTQIYFLIQIRFDKFSI